MDHLSYSHKNDTVVIINDYSLETGGGGGEEGLCVLSPPAPLIQSRLSAVVGRSGWQIT